MKTSFKTRVLRMGLSSFVDIDIFVMKYLFLPILHFSRISQIKIYKMLRPQKGNSRVSLNDTLLNFGLCIRPWTLISLVRCTLTLTYTRSGCTQRARLLGKVQGVVVQATRDTFISSSRGKLTITAGSTTSYIIYNTRECLGMGSTIKKRIRIQNINISSKIRELLNK